MIVVFSGRQIGRIFTTILIILFVVWSILPNFGHAPRVLETLQEHAEMIEDHGHSHGFVEDLLWAVHGHDHDEMDHDHSPIMLSSTINVIQVPEQKDWRQLPSEYKGSPSILIERPPKC